MTVERERRLPSGDNDFIVRIRRRFVDRIARSVFMTEWGSAAFMLMVAVFFFAWFAPPLVSVASENQRLVGIGPTRWAGDQARYLGIVWTAVSQRTLQLDRPDQGHLYINLALAPSLLYSYIAPISEQAIILLLRWLSVAFAVGTIVVTSLLAGRIYSRAAAYIAGVMMLLASLTFAQTAVVAHSDMCQLFFIALGMLCVCTYVRDGKISSLIFAAGAAGFAFGAKYVGVLLTPLIFMAILVQSTREASQCRRPAPKWLLLMRTYIFEVVIVLLLAAGILITPELIVYYSRGYGNQGVGGWLQFWSVVRWGALAVGLGLVLLFLVKPARKMMLRQTLLRDVLAKMTLSVSAFGLTCFLSSPFAFRDMIRGISFQSSHMTYGHVFQDSVGLGWLQLLASRDQLPPVVLGFALIGVFMVLFGLARRPAWTLTTPSFFVAAWVVLYLAVLVLKVNKSGAHYLLPVLPFVLVLAAGGVCGTARLLRALRRSGALALGIPIVLAALVGSDLLLSVVSMAEYRDDVPHFYEHSVPLKVGQWLAEHYDPPTRILYDRGVYVPPAFRDTRETDGGTLELLREWSPNVVVVCDSISMRFRDIQMGKTYLYGKKRFKTIYDYYQSFLEGTAGYRLQAEFEGVQVYERR